MCPNLLLAGGLPNITLEPRKPVDMGTMLKAVADQKTGIMMGLEVQESAEVGVSVFRYFHSHTLNVFFVLLLGVGHGPKGVL